MKTSKIRFFKLLRKAADNILIDLKEFQGFETSIEIESHIATVIDRHFAPLRRQLADAVRERDEAKEQLEKVRNDLEAQLSVVQINCRSAEAQLTALRAALTEKCLEADTMRQHHANAEKILSALQHKADAADRLAYALRLSDAVLQTIQIHNGDMRDGIPAARKENCEALRQHADATKDNG